MIPSRRYWYRNGSSVPGSSGRRTAEANVIEITRIWAPSHAGNHRPAPVPRIGRLNPDHHPLWHLLKSEEQTPPADAHDSCRSPSPPAGSGHPLFPRNCAVRSTSRSKSRITSASAKIDLVRQPHPATATSPTADDHPPAPGSKPKTKSAITIETPR